MINDTGYKQIDFHIKNFSKYRNIAIKTQKADSFQQERIGLNLGSHF
ncbi:MAG: hypothetical protein IGBAC_1639 [Ignavibacteriae bacterium]|nr:MAG: hypothetical protein IGBAC_1639 [Ignavibacteriota bacterium]